jgi:hypothetical protein
MNVAPGMTVVCGTTGEPAQILPVAPRVENNTTYYYAAVGGIGQKMWLRASDLQSTPAIPKILFNRRSPHLLVVDNFFKDPDAIRQFALDQKFQESPQFYKGKRTAESFLWPGLKEELERLLQRSVNNWINSGAANGCFQITGYNDPLVWHSDAQMNAAAIYLTPNAPIGAGTSFWRSKATGCRRPPNHPLEAPRFATTRDMESAGDVMYTGDTITRPEPWELVDRVGAVYNRLVIWDAQLIHSASSYDGILGTSPEDSRLVQLFFFD